MTRITADLPNQERKWGSISGGTGEGEGALYPQALRSGRRTEGSACSDSPYYHGGMVWFVWGLDDGDLVGGD